MFPQFSLVPRKALEMHLLVPEVATLVVTHVPLRPETLTAILWTRIGSLVLVDSDMNLEVLLLTEGLITAWKRTLERLSPIMDMHVGLQTYLT